MEVLETLPRGMSRRVLESRAREVDRLELKRTDFLYTKGVNVRLFVVLFRQDGLACFWGRVLTEGMSRLKSRKFVVIGEGMEANIEFAREREQHNQW